jgi:hypothetical protein
MKSDCLETSFSSMVFVKRSSSMMPMRRVAESGMGVRGVGVLFTAEDGPDGPIGGDVYGAVVPEVEDDSGAAVWGDGWAFPVP